MYNGDLLRLVMLNLRKKKQFPPQQVSFKTYFDTTEFLSNTIIMIINKHVNMVSKFNLTNISI